jgi:predicted nicotinamide N-methyase
MASSPAVVESLGVQLATLRGGTVDELPPALLDVKIRRVPIAGGDVLLPRPANWEQLRQEEAEAGRPIPYWAQPWPSGIALARSLAKQPPRRGRRVLELGCGLGLPSIVAAREGAMVLATDGCTDAIAYTAHAMWLNGVRGEVAHVDWNDHGDGLADLGPWDLVVASDVLYTRANVETALRLMPRLLAIGGELRIADPDRAGARDFLASARARFHLWTRQDGDVKLHLLTPR